MKEKIEELVNKWINEEIKLRQRASKISRESPSSWTILLMADTLSDKRRELQVAAGLVVIP